MVTVLEYCNWYVLFIGNCLSTFNNYRL